MSHDELVRGFASNELAADYVFEQHLTENIKFIDKDNIKAWVKYAGEIVHAAALEDYAKRVVAPDNVENTVGSEVRLLQLKDFVEVQRYALD